MCETPAARSVAGMEPTAIEVHDLHKSYDGRPVLQGVTFVVGRGEIFGIGLLAFFPLYLLGGGGPPRGVVTGAMHVVSDLIPSTVPAIVDPWLGLPGLGSQLAVLAAWAAVGLLACAWLARRTPV